MYPAVKRIKNALHKITKGKEVTYTSNKPLKQSSVSQQAKKMKSTLEKNRKSNKHSSGRGVGY